jgi:hypothetical protein
MPNIVAVTNTVPIRSPGGKISNSNRIISDGLPINYKKKLTNLVFLLPQAFSKEFFANTVSLSKKRVFSLYPIIVIQANFRPLLHFPNQ